MARDPGPAGRIQSLFVGTAEARWPGRPPSAIGKQPTAGPLRLDWTGFIDDEQADLSVHGGLEKAVHHYAGEHMAFWKSEFPGKEDFFASGCFGENVSTSGLSETNLCLGDVFSFGTARVQVCQGRQPCWKLNAHTGLESMAARFQTSGRTGWYYRVLETGIVEAGSVMSLLDRIHPDWPLNQVIKARFDANLPLSLAGDLSRLPALSSSWRRAFERKSQRGYNENTDLRLKGP